MAEMQVQMTCETTLNATPEPSISELQKRVADSPAFVLFEADCRLPFPDDAVNAAMQRLNRNWYDPESLIHALRGEFLTEDAAHELAAADRRAFDQLLAEDEAREARARMKRNDEEEAA
jgi:hypothetical protein